MRTEDLTNNSEYNITEESMHPKKVIQLSYLITVIFAVLYTVIYIFLRFGGDTESSIANIFVTIFKPSFLLEFFILMFFAFLFMGAGLFVKAALLARHCDNKWSGLKFKLVRGIEKPYCLTRQPVTIKQYMIAVFAYVFIVAFVPYIIAFIVGDFMFVFASFITVIWASGDILMLIRLRKKNRDDYILDLDCALLYKIYSKKK